MVFIISINFYAFYCTKIELINTIDLGEDKMMWGEDLNLYGNHIYMMMSWMSVGGIEIIPGRVDYPAL